MEPFIGQIQTFGFDFSPRRWALCSDQLLSISQNTALLSLLGTIYGRDRETTFGLPDKRGKTVIHFELGPGLFTFNIGQRGGIENAQLNINNIPVHSHNFKLGAAVKSTGSGTDNYVAFNTVSDTIYSANNLSGAQLGSQSIGNTGGSHAIKSRNPLLAVNI